MNEKKVINAVEMICATGCISVNAVIQALKSGLTVDGTEGFSVEELNELKNELISIMAVYEDRD